MKLTRTDDTFRPAARTFAPGQDRAPYVGPVYSVTATREHHERADGAPRADAPTYWSTREEADAHAAATLDASDPRLDPEAAHAADVLDACAHRDATSVAWMVGGAPLWRVSVRVSDVRIPATIPASRSYLRAAAAPAVGDSIVVADLYDAAAYIAACDAGTDLPAPIGTQTAQVWHVEETRPGVYDVTTVDPQDAHLAAPESLGRVIVDTRPETPDAGAGDWLAAFGEAGA